jgi:DNA segregation ATPase FtsK/SpoIIIE and related proteins
MKSNGAKKPRKGSKQQQKMEMQVEIICAVLFVLLLITILGEFKLTMIVGDVLVFAWRFLFGYLRYVLYGITGYLLYYGFRYKAFVKVGLKFFGFILVILTSQIFVTIIGYSDVDSVNNGIILFLEKISLDSVISSFDAGGIIGVIMFLYLRQLIGLAGVYVICLLLMLLGFSFILGKTLYEMINPPLRKTKSGINAAKETINSTIQTRRENRKKKLLYDVETEYDEIEMEDNFLENDIEYYDYEAIADISEEIDYMPITHTHHDIQQNEQIINDNPFEENENRNLNVDTTKNADNDENIEFINDVTQEEKSIAKTVKPYKMPNLRLLNAILRQQELYGHDRTKQMKLLQDTLDSFSINAKVTAVRVGPAITQYEVTLAPGVKVNRIVNLATDISLALAAKGVRIEAPIPGKAAVGIEVPNESVQMVGLQEVLKKGYQDKSQKLLVGLGRTISGEEVQVELNKMPHLLVAGSTGSGKSVCINTIIVSILLRATPDEVKFLMVDPKKVELNVYNDIPHLLAPVVTNPKKAAVALRKVVSIMEERYEIFADAFVRNLEGYNSYAEENDLEKLPYIVVIIDELSDLMVVAAKEVEESIMRLAQMARAAGIHMVVATQRPSVDVITGIIKSNIPSRIAFAVSSQIDSRTILDMSGAEKLVGKGDMLYLPAGEAMPIRVQGAFVSESEIEKIIDFLKMQNQNIEVKYDEELLKVEKTEVTEGMDFSDEIEDPLFIEAVKFAISIEMISISKLQRRFKMGFNRAARIMDEMIERGILGPAAGNKGRPVLIKDASELEQNSESINDEFEK